MLENQKSELNNCKVEVCCLEMKMNITKQTDSAAVADMLSTLSTEICSDLYSLTEERTRSVISKTRSNSVHSVW